MSDLSDSFFDLLFDMLRTDPAKRATCKSLLDYKYFDEYRLFPRNFFGNMYDPQENH